MDQQPQPRKRGGSATGHPRQCRAHSSRSGDRCRKFAIRGAPTCRSHGSAARHVRQAARLRIAALVDPALDVFAKVLMPGGSHVKPELRLRAAFDVLDRNGLKATDELTLTQQLAPSFGRLADDELESLLALLRKASIPVDGHDR